MENWRECKLEDIIEFNPKETIQKGSIAKKIEMSQLIPFCRDVIGYTKEIFYSGTKFRNGDTIMARITPCLENGKTAKISLLNDNEIGFGSTEYIILRAKKEISDADYIYYLATSSFVRECAIKSMVGSSGRQRVQLDVVKNLEISCPSYTEQQKIAKLLRLLDDEIELKQQINANLEQQAQAIFKSWFIDFEPFGGTMPDDWQKACLLDIADYTNGLAMQKYRPTSHEQGIFVMKIKELRQGFCDSSSELCSNTVNPFYLIHNGDVIFSWSGSLLVDFWCGGLCGLNQHLFKVTSNKYAKWFYYCWTKFHLHHFITEAADKATTMGHIKRENLAKAEVVIPTKQVYLTVGDLLGQIYNLMIANRIEINTLSALRDTLLPKLMSGEIDVSKIEID